MNPLVWLAHWYYLNYIRPLIIAEIKAEAAKAAMPRHRYIGDT